MVYRKYRNKPVRLDDYYFPSQREARRYQELLLQQKAGLISQLEVHPRFKIEVNNQKICVYEGDFMYLKDGVRVIEDTKGVRTPVYKLKKRLMEVVLGLRVEEV